MRAIVIGAGLAGCEAAYQLAKRNIEVTLYDMKPEKRSEAHSLDGFAELVCSNSLRAANIENAVGLLKQEMRELDSLIIEAADKTAVPAGGALAVDRQGFSDYVTDAIKNNPLITFETKKCDSVPRDCEVIVATGPLTTGELFSDIKELIGSDNLYFFDAAAPIVAKESIDFDIAFYQSRYGKGSDDYINCPMNESEYKAFYEALISAETAQLHEFESKKVFEGCMPIEEMAKRGIETMRFGPLKPVGITNPNSDTPPYAVVQLRQDDAARTLYNIVGFQTHLKFSEQKRAFSMIPGLQNAQFERYGVMHRNTYINSPTALNDKFQLKAQPNIFFAGQMTGVEGYVESAASGLLAGMFLADKMQGRESAVFTRETAIGALAKYISSANAKDFQPMNVNFGIMEPPDFKFKGKRDKNEKLAKRALLKIAEIKNTLE